MYTALSVLTVRTPREVLLSVQCGAKVLQIHWESWSEKDLGAKRLRWGGLSLGRLGRLSMWNSSMQDCSVPPSS